MKNILLFLLFCALAIPAMSQSGLIKGKLTDKSTGEPIPFVNLFWCDGHTGAYSDFDGNFVLPDTGRCDTLIVQYVGYQSLRVYVAEGTTHLDLSLESTSITLDAVEIVTTEVSYAKSSISCSSAVYERDDVSYESAPSMAYSRDGEVGTSAGYSGGDGIAAGQLTAGEVNDFQKWSLWTDINETDLGSYNTAWGLFPENRFCLQLSNKEHYAVVDAWVTLKDQDDLVIWRARTDNTGKAELWSGMFDGQKDRRCRIEVDYQGKVYSIDKPDGFHNGINFLELPTECVDLPAVDIAFMIDATGSMGDEISYLQAELTDVIERVKDTLPGRKVRLAMVFYRDIGDSYVVIKKDFTSNTAEAISYLKEQSAGGGGDFPEAVDSALDVSVNDLSWSNEASARMLFMVLDAPPHSEAGVISNIHRTIPIAATKGIRIVPIACSGIDKSTEYLLRSFALATNGTYVFLTDHSGIGNAHIAPTTDDYKVELLNDALIRIITTFSTTSNCKQPDVVKNQDTAVAMMVIPDSAVIDPINPDSMSFDTLKNDSITSDSLFPDVPEIIWRYYPNPTSGELTIEVENLPEGTSGELFLADITGKLVRRYDISEQKIIQINIGEFPSGTYFLTLYHSGDKKLTAPVILVH